MFYRFLLLCLLLQPLLADGTIKIGVLHSLTGTMSESEKPVVDAVALAVDEINQKGGVLGKRVEMVIADGKSSPNVFASEADRLIEKEKVSVIFGCWTSASRKAVKPIIEKHNNLLFYPVQYEGLEMSKNIFYTGMVANQQLFPAVKWASARLGSRFFLVGSDYIFPRTANLIIKDLAGFHSSSIIAERYIPLGGKDVIAIVDEIEKTKPSVIFNTINGDTNQFFFAELLKRGLDSIPIISFSVAENEMLKYGGSKLKEHYAVWSYFQSDKCPENEKFVKALKEKFGQNRVVDDPMKSAYVGVHLWANGVKEARAIEPTRVNQAVLRQSMKAPAGIVAVDFDTRHLWQSSKIGKVAPNGQFVIVYQTPKLLRPNPFPIYRSRHEWGKIINELEGHK